MSAPEGNSAGYGAGDFKALNVEIRNLTENVAALRQTIDRNTQQLAKIEVLEEKHDSQTKAVDRAFNEIRSITAKSEQHDKDDAVAHDAILDTIAKHAEDNAKEHRGYDKYLYMSIGFVIAVCMFWTIFGIRLNNTIDETLKSIAELKTEVAVDKAVKANSYRPPPNGG